jgi:hypothetical protein
MIATDAGAAQGTLAVALLLFAGQLEMWHIYTAVAIERGLHGASTSLLVPKEQFARAMGWCSSGRRGAHRRARPGRGADGLVGFHGILPIDFATSPAQAEPAAAGAADRRRTTPKRACPRPSEREGARL